MRNIFLACFFIFFPVFLASADWSCETVADCSAGMNCKDNSCVVTSNNFSTYAAVSLTMGKNSPNSLGSKKIFVEHPAKNVVLGQLAINAYNGGDEGKYFLLKELNATMILSSALLIIPENIRLVYDSNGNGNFDSSEKVVALNTSEETSKVKFEIDKTKASYKMNVAENFLFVGDFSLNQTVDKIWDFFVEFKPYQGSDTKVLISNAGEVVIGTIPERVTFPKFAFEPEKGYFLFASGKYFPSAPSWKEMNKEQPIMNFRVKSLEGNNSVNSISVHLTGNVASFGKGIKNISLYTDDNNDGKTDELISEVSSFETPEQIAKFVIPSGKLSMNEGEEKNLIVTADIEFYNGQTTQFYIGENDVALSSAKQFAGLPVSTEEFRYSCDETDSECNPAPSSEEEEVPEDDGGCSVILIH